MIFFFGQLFEIIGPVHSTLEAIKKRKSFVSAFFMMSPKVVVVILF